MVSDNGICLELAKLKTDTSSGPDGIPCIRELHCEIIDLLIKICNIAKNKFLIKMVVKITLIKTTSEITDLVNLTSVPSKSEESIQ